MRSALTVLQSAFLLPNDSLAAVPDLGEIPAGNAMN